MNIINLRMASMKKMRPTRIFFTPDLCGLTMIVIVVALALGLMMSANLAQQQQQQQSSDTSESSGPNSVRDQVVPGPERRPNVRVNIGEWSKRVSDDIRLVSNRSSCTQKIGQIYQREAQFQRFDAAKLRDSILIQIQLLLGQHRAALSSIVDEAERAAAEHVFKKDLRINYTDVHRLRNELESQQAQIEQEQAAAALSSQAALNTASSMSAGSQSTTSISGGTPVPGPPEWQTPVKSLALRVNKNFGTIPVNLSASAVHLPLPIYAGLPEIMNGIAWTEQLDKVFRKNLEQFAHVHHQYYGDRLGFMRTYPAHKWRIPRTEPDLFDARTRPWYIAGAATPKDVVVLVDTSGSMTGLRREIAKGVVFELLDTLTVRDHFAVLRFSESVAPVGMPKCANLRQPRLTPQLENECPIYYHPHHNNIMPNNQAAAATTTTTTTTTSRQQHPASFATASGDSASIECANFRHQWDTRGQYLRDHPNVVLGKNGTYITDDAYRRSIINITNDIRDAYLLPATSRNIRYLKSNFTIPTAGIANFTHALMAAFELLNAYNRTNELGSQCQQAIMLITDGAIREHEDVFNRYNYPGSPVRVFTYMIGREVGDIGPTKAMACRNRGYYTHVINLSEVREQVQKYLAVMARPLVLAQQHPISWTNVYGDETYQVLTDWVLEMKRRERARLVLNEERERQNDAGYLINVELTNITEYDELPLVDEQLKNRIICENFQFDDQKVMDKSLEDELDPLGYNEPACHWTTRRADLLTSVVKPVFDVHNTSLIFERVLSKNVWTERETRVRNAQLLGVAAVDLRVADILRAIPSHLLGPNGYAILLGQNGFVMHHPDHRALLEDPFDRQSKILKPYFNAVDLTHIEQVHHRNESESSARKRNEDIKLIKLREAAIRKTTGSESIVVKRSVDCRRRPHIRQQAFYYGPVRDTPFSIMLALPKSYGLHRVQAKLQLSRATQLHFSPSEYDLLTVHPDYRYCERVSSTPSSGISSSHHDQQQQQQQHYSVSQNESLRTLFDLFKLAAEDEAAAERALELADLSAVSEETGAGGRGRNHQGQQASQIKQQRQQQLTDQEINASTKFICDKELFPSLLFDARATHEPAGGSALCCMQPVGSHFGRQRSQEDAAAAAGPHCNAQPDEIRSTLAKSYGLEMSFLATRSGLTRTRVFDLSARSKKLAELFIERHSKAVDESWYARTVDWNMRSSETLSSTMVSVPYNAHIRLVAKLRQRITERHPAANDTRSNCDPSLDDGADYTDSAESSGGGASNGSQPQQDINESTIDTNQMQNDEPTATSDTASSSSASADQSSPASSAPSRINYADYSSFEMLDLLANSSVHVAATQTIVANNGAEMRAPIGVTGHLYDYASFARRFLNSTSLSIQTMPADNDNLIESGLVSKVQICPNGQCPTQCGMRTDTIDCLLVDNNGYIVVGEELVHVGRSLVDYDEQLMSSLVERRIYQPITITDYQAICARNDQAEVAARQAAAFVAQQQQAAASAQSALLQQQQARSSSGSSSSLSVLDAWNSARFELGARLLANFARALVYTTTTIYSALFLRSTMSPDELLRTSEPGSFLAQLYQWQRSAIMTADAQSSSMANQSLLALMPNKTYLRPCEKQMTLYDLRPALATLEGNDSPTYYETKCGCSGWYVFDYVPETNLLILMVNTSAPCRRCDTTAPGQASSGPLAPAMTPLVIDTTSLPGGGSSSMAASANQAQQQTNSGAQSSNLAPARTSAEDQVCLMLERDAQLYVARPSACLASHPDESQIHLCGAGSQLERTRPLLLLLLLACSMLLRPSTMQRAGRIVAQ